MATPSAWPRWIVTGAVALGLGWALWTHVALLLPFVLALALAYVLEPLVERLQRWGLPRPAGVLLTLLLTIVAGLLLVLLLVPIVAELAPMLKAQLPELVARSWQAVRPRLVEAGVRLPAELNDLRPAIARLINQDAEGWALTALSSLRLGSSLLLSLAGLLFLVPIVAFYLLLDWRRLWTAALQVLPWRWQPVCREVAQESDAVLGQYLRGQLIVMFMLAAYYSAGMALFGLHLALPLGVFTGLVACIPYLGFGLSLTLALLAAILQFMPGPEGLGWAWLSVGVVYGGGQFLESMVLTPRLVGERIGLHPVGVLLALVLFGHWMGFVGVLAALPLSALAVVILRRLLHAYQASAFYREPPSAPPEPGQPESGECTG